ncbi:MAG TPA: hypothetical protein VFM11_09750, partial [Burkholderiales bacterium]|nr:hypothetical protein [Burkholderiales bacterium]
MLYRGAQYALSFDNLSNPVLCFDARKELHVITPPRNELKRGGGAVKGLSRASFLLFLRSSITLIRYFLRVAGKLATTKGAVHVVLF